MTFCIAQLHPITLYKTVFLDVRCSGVECHYVSLYEALDRVLFHNDGGDYYWDFYSYSINLDLHLHALYSRVDLVLHIRTFFEVSVHGLSH